MQIFFETKLSMILEIANSTICISTAKYIILKILNKHFNYVYLKLFNSYLNRIFQSTLNTKVIILICRDKK